jgi:hypothetical protein
MPALKKLRCPYCLGRGRLPELKYIVPVAFAPFGESDTCPGCAGTGRLKPETGADAAIDTLTRFD